MVDFRTGLDRLKIYSIEEGDWDVKLDANESAFNLPPVVREKLMVRLAGLSFNRYPEITQWGLRKRIAADLGVLAENIVIGNGSSQLLQAACYIFGGEGSKIVFAEPSFPGYSIFCKLADAQAVIVDLEDDFSLPPAQILTTAKREAAKLIILCSPNNPTGNKMPLTAIQEIVENADCPVVVDEAYIEFGGESVLDLSVEYPNMIVMRTFSKAYGLASARVGYAVANQEIAAAMGKFLLSFNISTLSLIAADTVYENKIEFKKSISETVAERERLRSELMSIPGIYVFPSAANFLLVRVKEAAALVTALLASSICVRDFRIPRLEGCIRVTVGTTAENDALLAVVRKFSTCGALGKV